MTAAGFTLPAPLVAEFTALGSAPDVPALSPRKVPGLTHARLVARFGPVLKERAALAAARREDLWHGRWQALVPHLRWAVSRSLYSQGTAARAIRLGSRALPLLGGRVLGGRVLGGAARRARDVIVSRQCALLLARDRWRELADLTDWATRHRVLPSGDPYPADLYYRAFAQRHMLQPAAARQNAEAAASGLASALDPERLAGALLEASAAAVYQGRFEDALRYAFDLRRRRGRYAIPRWQAWGGCMEAIALCHQGKPARAREALRGAWERFEDEERWGGSSTWRPCTSSRTASASRWASRKRILLPSRAERAHPASVTTSTSSWPTSPWPVTTWTTPGPGTSASAASLRARRPPCPPPSG